MYKAQEPDLFLRSNRAALCRGVELMSASRMLVGIALVTQLDRNKASLYLNSLIFTTNWTVLPFLGGEGAGELVQGRTREGERERPVCMEQGASHQQTLSHYSPSHPSFKPPAPRWWSRAAAAGPASAGREAGQWNVRIIRVAQALLGVQVMSVFPLYASLFGGL